MDSLVELDGADPAAALERRLAAAGASPRQARRILRDWIRGRGVGAAADSRDAPFGRRLRAELAELARELDSVARVVARQAGSDGSLLSERFVVALADGRRVEVVALPSGSACLSSQVGCAVGCGFCATGIGGLERQMTALEIVATFAALAQAHTGRPLRRALFMGMGEPAHNSAAVLAAGRMLAEHGDLGRHNVVVSTVGDRRLFERLHAGGFRPALALSLHSADDEQRRRLLPFAPPIPVAELVELGQGYARFGAYPVQAQWVLLAGVNDSDADLLRAVPLLRGTRIVLNLIPWNPLPELPYARPDRERCRAAVRLLMRAGVFAKLRWSAGAEADAACGQLRASRTESTSSSRRAHAGVGRGEN
jgi:23S rRNA (adenine2503-C2)-methyltransferase